MAVKSQDQITIIDVTDAYSVMLTSETYTFAGGVAGVPAGNTCSTQAVAYCGSNRCASVNVNAADIVCPTGIAASVANNGSNAVTVTFTTNAMVSASCEATIPVSVDGVVVNKKFSFAVAKTGATGSQGAAGTDGNGVQSTVVEYQTGSDGTTAPTGAWTAAIPTVTAGQFLWTRTTITYTDHTSSTVYSVGMMGATGPTGATGSAGKGISSTKVTYQAGSSGTSAPTGTWADTPPAVGAGQYLWTRTTITYTDASSSTAYAVGMMGATGATGATGETGQAGADAITLTVTSSAGTVFKNSSGSTVLTAHVFVGAVEQTITDAGVCGSIGSVKWYKGSSSTAAATARTLTISASDVATSLAVTAQLEQ